MLVSILVSFFSFFVFLKQEIMDQVMQFVEPSRQFVKDSIRLVKRCTKPDRKGNSFNIKKKINFFQILYLTSSWLITIAGLGCISVVECLHHHHCHHPHTHKVVIATIALLLSTFLLIYFVLLLSSNATYILYSAV